MDLRKEINNIIEEKGHYVLLQRTSGKLRCVCWNERYQEASSDCPRCLGKGFVSRIERHKVRRQLATNIISLPGKKKQTPMGQIIQDTRTFFFKHNVHPKKGDIIMEVGWNGQRPTHLIQAFEITNADDKREDGGRTEFYLVTTKERNISTPIRHVVIRQLGRIQNYEILQ